MARPKPNIIIDYVDKKYNSEQILEALPFMQCFMKVSPLTYEHLIHSLNYPGPKYKKVSFSNSGHAFNLCDRLNKMFSTHKFTVIKLTQGEIVTRDDKRNPGKIT